MKIVLSKYMNNSWPDGNFSGILGLPRQNINLLLFLTYHFKAHVLNKQIYESVDTCGKILYIIVYKLNEQDNFTSAKSEDLDFFNNDNRSTFLVLLVLRQSITRPRRWSGRAVVQLIYMK